MKKSNNCIDFSKYFSSGTVRKHKGWNIDSLGTAPIGKALRGKDFEKTAEELIELTKKALKIPDGYKIILVPGSITNTMTASLWNFLPEGSVDVICSGHFSTLWGLECFNLPLQDIRVIYNDPSTGQDITFNRKEFEEILKDSSLDKNNATKAISSEAIQKFVRVRSLPDLEALDDARHKVFCMTDSSTGISMLEEINKLDWASSSHSGLTICDAATCAFNSPMPWEKLDATCFGWYKALGAEPWYGALVLSPRAQEALKSKKSTSIPLTLRLSESRFFEKNLFNTASPLCIQDSLNAVKWFESLGAEYLQEQVKHRFSLVYEWTQKRDWISFFCNKKSQIGPTPLVLDLQKDLGDNICNHLEDNGLALGIRPYRNLGKGIRIFNGCTMEKEDLERLLKEIDRFVDN